MLEKEQTLSAEWRNSVRHNYKYIFTFTNIMVPKEIFKITYRCLSFWSRSGWALNSTGPHGDLYFDLCHVSRFMFSLVCNNQGNGWMYTLSALQLTFVFLLSIRGPCSYSSSYSSSSTSSSLAHPLLQLYICQICLSSLWIQQHCIWIFLLLSLSHF